MKRVGRGRLEGGIDPEVERGRLRILGMDEERTDADAIGNGCDLEDEVLESAEPSPLPCSLTSTPSRASTTTGTGSRPSPCLRRSVASLDATDPALSA